MNKFFPTVSIIIPVYNNERFLKEAIESILTQNYRNIEIIIVNDGSTENLSKIAKTYNGVCKWVNQTNKGPANARNTGLKFATGKYINFLDSDDLFLPGKLDIHLKFLETHPNIDLVYSDGFKFKINSYSQELSVPLSENGDLKKGKLKFNTYISELIVHNIFPIHAPLIKRSCLIDVGGFDENLTACEDWDLWFRIAEKYNFYFLDGYLIKYRDTPGSNSSDFLRNYKELNKVMGKIEGSFSFGLATNDVLSEFYYNRGVVLLALNDINNAIINFRKSIALQPKRKKVQIALILSLMFKDKAFLFYRIKRSLLGVHGKQDIN